MPSYPAGYAKSASTSATCNPTRLQLRSGATFGVTKGSAYNRNWKFAV